MSLRRCLPDLVPIAAVSALALTAASLPVFALSAAAQDTVTLAPTLTDPASGGALGASFMVAYTLPEAAASGTVTLRFLNTGGVASVTQLLTLAPSQESAGVHAFILDGTNLGAAPEVAQVSGGTGALTDNSVYQVTLAYRDALLNPAASASSYSVIYEPSPVPARASTWGALKLRYAPPA